MGLKTMKMDMAKYRIQPPIANRSNGIHSPCVKLNIYKAYPQEVHLFGKGISSFRRFFVPSLRNDPSSFQLLTTSFEFEIPTSQTILPISIPISPCELHRDHPRFSTPHTMNKEPMNNSFPSLTPQFITPVNHLHRSASLITPQPTSLIEESV